MEQEYQKIYENLGGRENSRDRSAQRNDDLSVRVGEPRGATTAPTNPVYNPQLFNFEHPYDPELTPRKKWKETVTNLDAIIETEREKFRQLEIQQIEQKQNFESEIVHLNSQLGEAEMKANFLQQELEREQN